MPKQRRYPKRQPAPKVAPRRACYSIADNDVLGIEFDARFKGQENYSRLFFIPEGDKLYLWRIDRRPEKFVKIPITSISPKRKDSLIKVWQGQLSEELAKA
jgi:hypothetical protein